MIIICKSIDMSVNMDIQDIELGMLQMQILWLLGSKPMHGYELMKKLTEIKRNEITQGALYPTLSKLRELGLIKVESEGPRGKKTYQLTGEGKRIMTKTCREFCRAFEGIFKDFICNCCPELEKVR